MDQSVVFMLTASKSFENNQNSRKHPFALTSRKVAVFATTVNTHTPSKRCPPHLNACPVCGIETATVVMDQLVATLMQSLKPRNHLRMIFREWTVHYRRRHSVHLQHPLYTLHWCKGPLLRSTNLITAIVMCRLAWVFWICLWLPLPSAMGILQNPPLWMGLISVLDADRLSVVFVKFLMNAPSSWGCCNFYKNSLFPPHRLRLNVLYVILEITDPRRTPLQFSSPLPTSSHIYIRFVYMLPAAQVLSIKSQPSILWLSVTVKHRWQISTQDILFNLNRKKSS